MRKHPYEIHQEFERERETEELKIIIDKPHLEPEELWAITPDNFFRWRKKHDFPRILSHFSNKLIGFDDWKKEYNFSDDELISYGLSNCINANPAKDKRKFIVQRTWENEVSKFISYQNIDGKFYNMGPNLVNHKVIVTFTGYIDWCNAKGIKIMKDWKDNGILSRPSSTHPVGNPLAIDVSILDGLKLLKIGGIEVNADAFGLIKPKYFEFVNADYLKISGRIATAGHQLIFENSFVDKLTCENLDLALVQFRNCNVSDFYAVNSSFQQWSFNLCSVNGKAFNTDFKMVSIYGGTFNTDFKDCTFYNVDARQSSKNDLAYESTYRTFKTVYADQGDDKKAIEYFLLEKAVERQRIKKEIFIYQRFGLFKESKKELFIQRSKSVAVNLLKFISLWINNFYWGYGRKPFRVVRNSLTLILLFSVVYYFSQSSMNMPHNETSMTIWDSFYFSTVTFTTLGYGDFSPIGFLRNVAATEAFVGGISLGFLVAGFSNFKY